MFCPSCGLEDKLVNQFCRACGADLRLVRGALAKPDDITSSAQTAREEIGRAFAAKIREAQTAVEMKIVAEDVLPEIEKFLESPHEKRLRRVRLGTLLALIGAGATIGFALASRLMGDGGILILAALGIVCLFLGLSFVVNGLLFTVPKKLPPADQSNAAARQHELDAQTTNELALPEAANFNEFTSVIENTTQHLKEKQPLRAARSKFSEKVVIG